VLLFDECDSLLMDRNIVGPILGATINCLLTEIERFKGVVIFTTNRLGKLDAALERRISAKIEFPFPDKPQRVEIWRRMIPKKAPLDKSVDFEVLAELVLPGGNIKNAVLSAARAAAHAGQKRITQENLLTAAKAEVASRDEFKQQIDRQDHTHVVHDFAQSEFGQVVRAVQESEKARDWLPVRMMGGKN
jgi:AAA+ superfamily predicted ATPase